ncbi:MAG: RidA family protein [Pseudomonadota bacterium]
MHKAIAAPDLRAPFARYSHGIEVPAGYRVVMTSGQLPVAADDTVPEGAEAQAALVFDNIATILSEAGMTLADVVRVNAYVTHRDHMAGYMTARDAAFATVSPPPASTLMIVGGFTRPEFLVEIEVTAAAP